MLSGSIWPNLGTETKYKNGTVRQLNYYCIESINGDMKKRREQIFMRQIVPQT